MAIMTLLTIEWTEFPYNLVPFIAVMMIVMALMSRYRRIKRQQPPASTAAEQIEQVRQVRGIRGDLGNVMVEVEQLAKRFGAQLDAKSVHLNKLIEQADQRIATLQSLENAAPSPKQAPNPTPPAEPAEDELTTSIYRLADQCTDSREIARITGEHVGKVELILALRKA